MIESLTDKQIQWVNDHGIGYSQMDGVWLCDTAGVRDV